MVCIADLSLAHEHEIIVNLKGFRRRLKERHKDVDLHVQYRMPALRASLINRLITCSI